MAGWSVKVLSTGYGINEGKLMEWVHSLIFLVGVYLFLVVIHLGD